MDAGRITNHFPKLYGYFTCKDRGYLVLQQGGTTLLEYAGSRKKSGKPMTAGEWHVIIQQVLTACRDMNDKLGLYHRDMHPKNIIFKGKDLYSEIMIIDFGRSNTKKSPKSKYRDFSSFLGLLGKWKLITPSIMQTWETLS